MNLIQQIVNQFLPPKKKNTPSGWISFNAPCCHHRGENIDKRMRGGIMFSDDGWQYHCFNCNFKAGWTPGKMLSKNSKDLLNWLGIPDAEIQKINLAVLKSKEDIPKPQKIITFDLDEKPLPEGTVKIADLLNAGFQDENFLSVVEYLLIKRQMGLDWYNWMWTDEPGYSDRVIIPFYNKGTVVGWTGRKISDGKPKYLTSAQPGYVFNIDRQTVDRKYIIIVEGQFDAIAIDGCAIMHNEPNETQIARIKQQNKEVIVVPDRDKPGAKLIKSALDNDWSVSLPDWGDHIKDVADAVKVYGRLYTLYAILQAKESNKIKIEFLRKRLENINE